MAPPLPLLIGFIYLSALLVSASPGLAAEFTGMVLDQQGRSINNAIVRLQGTSSTATTDEQGHFFITTDAAVNSKYLTAWKDGYYNAGQPVLAETKDYRIVLQPVPHGDAKDYVWRASMPAQLSSTAVAAPENKPCQDCHPALTEQWRQSAHGLSAVNPVFLAFYNGTDRHGGRGMGPGYKLDFQNSNGNCATCHVPALGLINPFNGDASAARGVEQEGVFCDLCHKIDGVRLDPTGGYPGTLSMQFSRPPAGHQLFYGPYDDVFPGDDSYHPLYKQSRYCAPCHQGKFWGVPVYSEFQEWADSDYPAKNIHCQDCHMSSDGKTTRFALEKEGSVERNPAAIPSHAFSGVKDQAFMAEAIDLAVQAEQQADEVQVTITIKNVKAGHHYPTGNPMRNMILLVAAADGEDRALSLLEGEKVPVWGGEGEVAEGNFAGLPGKGFAKVLRDAAPYPAGQQRHFRPEYPASHWRPALVESDNRIPANGSDISTYRYRVPAGLRGPIKVSSRLIYRRAYKKWLDSKGFKTDDMEIARTGITVGRR